MVNSTSYLNFTTWCGPPQGYYDEPDFLTTIWPFLLEHSAVIANVYLFKNSFFGGLRYWQRTFGDQLSVAFKSRSELQIVDLGPMASLAPALLKDLRHRSFYGGHINVLYKTDNKDFLARLCKLWPTPGTISNEIDKIGLRQTESEFLMEFLSIISESNFVAAFGHDADPLYIFGKLQSLTELKRLAER